MSATTCSTTGRSSSAPLSLVWTSHTSSGSPRRSRRPEDEEEYENYTSLLGDVDFEIPTPAVIKEGDLAPFRDLAWWVEPTEEEAAFLRDVHASFLDAVEATTTSPGFTRWLGDDGRRILRDRQERTAWADWAADHDALARAAVTVGHLRGVAMPPAPSALLLAMGADVAPVR